MAPITMSGHVIARNGLSIGLVALAQTVVPTFFAVSLLYFLVFAFDAHLEQYFNAMAVLVTVLMLLLPPAARDEKQPMGSNHLPLVVGVFSRWAVLLVALLAIAYVAKLSGFYSRRVVLTWAGCSNGCCPAGGYISKFRMVGNDDHIAGHTDHCPVISEFLQVVAGLTIFWVNSPNSHDDLIDPHIFYGFFYQMAHQRHLSTPQETAHHHHFHTLGLSQDIRIHQRIDDYRQIVSLD